MAFNMRIANVEGEIITKNYRIYKENGKNYLEKNGKTYELSDGAISMKNDDVYIAGKKICIDEYN